MAFFTFAPLRQRQPATLEDAFLAGLTRGMYNRDPLFGRRDLLGWDREPEATRRSRRDLTLQDPLNAWLGWFGREESSESEGEDGESRKSVKRQASRSASAASSAPPKKKQEDDKKKGTKSLLDWNPSGWGDLQVVAIQPALWRHTVNVGSDFNPQDVKVYVKDGKMRIEGRRERNVGGGNDVVECMEFSREIAPPSDVILDDINVFFKDGGVLELSGPRRTPEPSSRGQELATGRQLAVNVVSQEEQEKQIEEHKQLMEMNMAGFEPGDVTVTTSPDGNRVTVRAKKEVEEDGFWSRKESVRSFLTPNGVSKSGVACTMGPDGRLVLTAPTTENSTDAKKGSAEKEKPAPTKVKAK